ALCEDANRHVLAALEGRGIAIEADPERGEGLRLVLASHEARVVLRRIGLDGSRIDVQHPAMVPASVPAASLPSGPPGRAGWLRAPRAPSRLPGALHAPQAALHAPRAA